MIRPLWKFLITLSVVLSPVHLRARLAVALEPFPDRLIVLTDLEGRQANLNIAIDNGDFELSTTESGPRLDFTDSHSEFIFAGDLFDRGKDSIKLRRMLLDLKKRYPERVTFLWGNREINKLTLLRDLPRLRQEFGNDSHKIVQSWAEAQGLTQVLSYHQLELSEQLSRPLTLAEAATDFIKQVQPGGEIFEFIRLGQIGKIVGNTLFVHGGVTDRNFGEIPGSSHKIPNARNWIERLNSWGQSQLNAIETSAKSGLPLNTLLLTYGDANWDPIGQQRLAEGRSVIYPDRFKEADNLRLPPDRTIDYLRTSGIDSVCVGHTPVGNIPLPLKTENKFLYLYMDTSMTEAGTHSYISFEKGIPRVRATLQSGKKIDFKVDRSDRYVGIMAGDYHVVGTDPEGNYVLFRYYERYKIDEKIVKSSEIFHFKANYPKFVVNEGSDAAKAKLIQHLNGTHVSIRGPLDIQSSMRLSGKQPILFSGASKFASRSEDEPLIRSEIKSMLQLMDYRKHVILTGGTHFGVEKIVHEEIRQWNLTHPKNKFELGALIIDRTSPSDLFKGLDWVSLVGHDWDEPLFRSIDLVKEFNGKALFIGGGGIVRAGIKRAAALDVDFHLMSDVSEGASKYYSTVYEKNSFSQGSRISFSDSKKISVMQSVSEVEHSFSISGKKVLTFGGFSGQGYQHRAEVEKLFKRIIAQFNPDEWIINIGVTPDGIGEGYKWTKELDSDIGLVLKYAKELRERGFETRGIVSSKALSSLADITRLDFADNLTVFEYIRNYVDAFHIVEDSTWGGLTDGVMSPTSQAMASVSTIMYGIGGGAVLRDEWREGIRLGKDVRYTKAEANHEKAIAKAIKSGKPIPTDFYGDAVILYDEVIAYRRCIQVMKSKTPL